MDEIWKDIPDWPFHQISNHGHVRVLPGGNVRMRLITETELRILTPNSAGYVTVFQGKRCFYVHVLVLNAFAGPCPPGFECRHLNGNNFDNRYPENIVWGTRRDNYQDRVRHGTTTVGERHPNAKLTEADILDIRKSSESNTQLAIEYGVRRETIRDIRSRKKWKHVYDIPKYPPMHLIPDMEPIEHPQMILSFGG